jgi:hypothetical protein
MKTKQKRKKRKIVGAKKLRQQIKIRNWRGNEMRKIKHENRNKKEERK